MSIKYITEYIYEINHLKIKIKMCVKILLKWYCLNPNANDILNHIYESLILIVTSDSQREGGKPMIIGSRWDDPCRKEQLGYRKRKQEKRDMRGVVEGTNHKINGLRITIANP